MNDTTSLKDAKRCADCRDSGFSISLDLDRDQRTRSTVRPVLAPVPSIKSSHHFEPLLGSRGWFSDSLSPVFQRT